MGSVDTPLAMVSGAREVCAREEVSGREPVRRSVRRLRSRRVSARERER